MMERDCQCVVVHPPELLENALGLAAGVDEDQRGAVSPDQLVYLAERVTGGVAGPWHALGGIEHGDLGLGAALRHDEIGRGGAVFRLRHQKATQIVRLGHSRGQSHAGEIGRQLEQPRQAERKQIAAFRRHQCVQLIEHDPLERAEQVRRIGCRQYQCELLGSGEQDMRRVAPLALSLRGRGVAGAGLDPDRQRHFGHRPLQIARDIDRERLERRDVKRVQAARPADLAASGDMRKSGLPDLRSAQFHQARQETCERLAGPRGSNEQHRAAGSGLGQQLDLMLPRRPAAAREPASKHVRQRRVVRHLQAARPLRHESPCGARASFVYLSLRVLQHI